jgi:hypothetical protein
MYAIFQNLNPENGYIFGKTHEFGDISKLSYIL